jgi:hypothetical protein
MVATSFSCCTKVFVVGARNDDAAADDDVTGVSLRLDGTNMENLF